MNIFIGAGFFVLILFLLLINPIIIWGFWDNIMVGIFGVRDITFWEAIMVSFLCSAMFKTPFSQNSSNRRKK